MLTCLLRDTAFNFQTGSGNLIFEINRLMMAVGWRWDKQVHQWRSRPHTNTRRSFWFSSVVTASKPTATCDPSWKWSWRAASGGSAATSRRCCRCFFCCCSPPSQHQRPLWETCGRAGRWALLILLSSDSAFSLYTLSHSACFFKNIYVYINDSWFVFKLFKTISGNPSNFFHAVNKPT